MPEDTTSKTEDKATLQRAAYSAAEKRLREENRDRFNALMAEEAQARGVDWKPRPTAEEKAQAELDRLLAEHPALAERLRNQTGETASA